MAEAVLNTRKPGDVECPNCGAQSVNEHFCSTCGKIQPVAAGTDYFSFFGLLRRLGLDEDELEKSFYSLSRKFHPDYFMNANEEERRASMERSSMLNDAYRMLRDRVARVQYLLSLEGHKEAEKKAPPDLLEQVFELNMQVEELKAAKKTGDEDELAEAISSLNEALTELSDKMRSIDEKLFALFEHWDSALIQSSAVELKRALLDRMSELLSHRSYIRNLVRDLKEEL